MLMTADTLLTGRELLRPGWIEVSERHCDPRRAQAVRRGPRTANSAR